MLKAIVTFCELVYDMMLLNVYWWRYTLLGGVLFSLIRQRSLSTIAFEKGFCRKMKLLSKNYLGFTIGTTNKRIAGFMLRLLF